MLGEKNVRPVQAGSSPMQGSGLHGESYRIVVAEALAAARRRVLHAGRAGIG